MVSRFCTENRLSFLFLVRVHHTQVRCNLVRKLARTVFKLASVEQSRFFMQQRLLFLSFVFCNWWGQRYIWRNVFLKYFVWDWWAGNKELYKEHFCFVLFWPTMVFLLVLQSSNLPGWSLSWLLCIPCSKSVSLLRDAPAWSLSNCRSNQDQSNFYWRRFVKDLSTGYTLFL